MAIKITDECINCGACEPECPNNAIYEGAVDWMLMILKSQLVTMFISSCQTNVQSVKASTKSHNVLQFVL